MSDILSQPINRNRNYAGQTAVFLKNNRKVTVGLVIVVLMLLAAAFAPLIAPHSPTEQNVNNRLQGPSWQYPMGTDDLGRCTFSRLIYGTRISLEVGIIVVVITTVFGSLLGLIAGYYGGILDEIIMRLVDILMAFPGIILALIIAGLLGQSFTNLIIAISFGGWTKYTRVARGVTLSTKEKGFIESTRALGGNNRYIMLRHILPESFSPIMVISTLSIGSTILSAAALSFLGLGVPPPTPEWGAMLSTGRHFMSTAPYLSIFPGLAIVLAVLAFNLLGDGLRDYFDPRLKKKIEL